MTLIVWFIFQFTIFTCVSGHGYLKTPRSRNWVAAEDGTWNGGSEYDGIPQTESCPHCLNVKEANDLCGVGNAVTKYDLWNDINGNPLPWTSQAIYEEGDEITVEAVLATNHAGHMEMWLCPDGNDSTQECLWNNPATMIRDELYGGPVDPDYPERGYFGTSTDFRFTYKLPDGLTGDQVLVQWRYITANSCIPPGYRPGNPVGNALLELGWLRNLGMVDCVPPYSSDGSRSPGSPEQFWNCAEITIIPSGPTPPTISPVPTAATSPAPSPTSPIGVPTLSPVSQPGPVPGYCNYGFHRDSSCDGQVEGGDWCNLSTTHCEDSCDGEWCTVVSVTNSPTNQGTSLPTKSPALLLPSLLPTSETSCMDTPYDFVVDGGSISCDWIQGHNAVSCLCDSQAIESHCPQTCGVCTSSTSPSFSSSCFEDPNALFFSRIGGNGPIYKTCSWLLTRSESQLEFNCNVDESNGGYSPAQVVCPMSCGICDPVQPYDVPSTSPSMSYECFEDPNALFFKGIGGNGPIYKPCSWLLTRSESQIEFNCNLDESNGGYSPAQEVCPITCGTCEVFDESYSA